jgi:Sulfotransferase domain
MWSVPRTVSTSFERMMVARGDHTVFDEPFSKHYYFGPERRSDRFEEELPGSSPDELLAEIEQAAEERPVFVKDMAYQASVLLEPETIGRFRNSFLVRDPAASLRSLAKHWPDFTDEETGWDALGRAADVVSAAGQEVVVVEANRLCDDPAAVVSAWCKAMDLDFVEDALTWKPGMRDDWELWDEWHETTSQATGFEELRDPPPPPTPHEPRLREAYERAAPIYERLVRQAL